MIIKRDADTIRSYFEDSSNLKGGYAQAVLIPSNIDELSSCIRDANSKKMPVTISGGGTGTTGSRIPFGGIVISMEKFNKILEISNEKMSALCQTGVLVEDLKNACEDHGLFYTSHPTEKTASVGGTVACNASGSRSFKYGPTRRYVKRLKMVMANGGILDVRRGQKRLKFGDSAFYLNDGAEITIPLPAYKIPNIKNSAGYFAKDGMDLIDLFIGQEGTLGVIVEVELGLVKRPAKIFSSFVFFKAEKDAWSFADEARSLSRKGADKTGSAIDALSVEYFDANAIRLLRNKDKNIPTGTEGAIFFEQGMDGREDAEVEGEWLRLISGHGVSLDDTWAAMNEKESEKFTELRHYIPEAINDIVRGGGFQKLSTDIAVPDDKFNEMMNFYVDSFEKYNLEHVIFGHIGESHVHINILPKSQSQLKAAQDMVLAFVKKGVALGGTISAEHGVGKTKHKYLEVMYGRTGILEMARIKKAIDPNCILGLDNIFPREILNEV